jgi:hypothetical protein
MPETRTSHYNDDGEQVTEREVTHEGETYRFEVDLDEADSTDDGHTYLDGDRSEVPDEVEAALREFGAGEEPTTEPTIEGGAADGD